MNLRLKIIAFAISSVIIGTANASNTDDLINSISNVDVEKDQPSSTDTISTDNDIIESIDDKISSIEERILIGLQESNEAKILIEPIVEEIQNEEIKIVDDVKVDDVKIDTDYNQVELQSIDNLKNPEHNNKIADDTFESMKNKFIENVIGKVSKIKSSLINETENIDRDNVVHIPKTIRDKMKDDILTENGIENYDESDLIFLNSLPVGTKYTFKKDYVVLPKSNTIIIQDGVTLINEPNLRDSPTSYCKINLNNSGRARIIKSGREFILIKNSSDVKKISNQSFVNGPLKIQHQTMWVDNPHVKNITCSSSSYLSENKLPLMIYDLYKQTGNDIKITFPAFEEI